MHVFFIGIGGISMSALAHICINKGYKVSGSDINDSDIIYNLKNKGANIYLEHNANNITSDIDMVVYTAAVKEDNPELSKAMKESHILTINRAAFLGQIMREYNNSICVAGTHGKTSTTSMLSAIFEYAKKDPTILVGGNLSIIGGNIKIGKSDNFITEACEYSDSFLNFNPTLGIILNIEEDHLDYFSGLDEIKASFNKFSKLLPASGYLIINGDDDNTKDILHDVKATIVKYGQNKDNQAIISNVSFNEDGFGSFDLTFENNTIHYELSVPGIHNIYNASSAIVTAIKSDISIDNIKGGLKSYTGVGRRFEKKGLLNGATIIDDYAHHPTELKATLSAAKNMCKGNLWCVFQPHTYSRTKSLLNEFSESFFSADHVIITDIYAAREKNPGDVNSEMLADKVKLNQKNTYYIKTFEEIESFLRDNLKPGDVLITAGAGDIYKLADNLS